MSDDRENHDGYRRFRAAMQQGRLQPGMLLTQNELCELLDMSMSPLRETLVLLEEYGLVDIKPRTGIRIVFPEVAFIRENFQFRIMIETHALRAFGDKVTDAWLTTMRLRHEECRTALEDLSQFDELQGRLKFLDNKMHRDIVESLDNRAILETHARLQDNLSMARRAHQRSVYRVQLVDTINEHLAVIEALEARDLTAAVSALEAHFRASSHRTFAA